MDLQHSKPAFPSGWPVCVLLLLMGFLAVTPLWSLPQAETSGQQTPKPQEALLPPTILEALEKQDYAAAAKALEDFLFAQAGHREALFQLAFCYSRLERPSDAIELYRELLELEPALFEARFNLGVLLAQQKKSLRAAEEFRQATELEPGHYPARHYYAMALESSGNTAGALMEYARAAELDPAALEPRRALVSLIREDRKNRKNNDQTQHAPLLDKLLALIPTDAALVELRADLFRLEEKPEAARQLYLDYFSAVEEKLTVPPKEAARIHQLAGRQAADLKQWKEAHKHYLLAGEIGGDEFEWISTYGQAHALASMERYAEAIPLYRRALELMGHDIDLDILEEFGSVLVFHQQYPEAIPLLVNLLEIDPERVAAYNRLAVALHALQNYRAAVEILQKRAQVAEETLATLFLRAISHDQLRQCLQAQEFYEKFLALNTDRRSDQFFQASGRRRALKKTCKEKRKGVQ